MKLNRYLDAAVLKPQFTKTEAEVAIQECVNINAITTCVRPCDVELANKICKGTNTSVGTVIAFPHGYQKPNIKYFEMLDFIETVSDLDMVINISNVKSHNWKYVYRDMYTPTSLLAEAHPELFKKLTIKVILETCYLTKEEITEITKCAIDTGLIDYVKTSTGFGTQGATVESVETMLKAADDKILVKASGGIKTREQAEMFINMGVKRLGVGFSSCQKILNNEINEVNENY